MSFWLRIASIVVGLIGAVYPLTQIGSITDRFVRTAGPGGHDFISPVGTAVITMSTVLGTVIGLIYVALGVIFAVFMRRGRKWARIALTVIGGLGVINALRAVTSSQSLQMFGQNVETGSTVGTILSILQAMLTIGGVVMFFRRWVSELFRAIQER